jgi:hypothetical protein
LEEIEVFLLVTGALLVFALVGLFPNEKIEDEEDPLELEEDEEDDDDDDDDEEEEDEEEVVAFGWFIFFFISSAAFMFASIITSRSAFPFPGGAVLYKSRYSFKLSWYSSSAVSSSVPFAIRAWDSRLSACWRI